MTVLEKTDLRALGEKSRGGRELSREEARAVLNWPENELLDVVAEGVTAEVNSQSTLMRNASATDNLRWQR